MTRVGKDSFIPGKWINDIYFAAFHLPLSSLVVLGSDRCGYVAGRVRASNLRRTVMNSTETFVVDWPVTGECRSITPQVTSRMSGHRMGHYQIRRCAYQEMPLAQGNAALPVGARSEARHLPALLPDSPGAGLAKAMV